MGEITCQHDDTAKAFSARTTVVNANRSSNKQLEFYGLESTVRSYIFKISCYYIYSINDAMMLQFQELSFILLIHFTSR